MAYKWHQFVAVAVMLKKMFTTTLGQPPEPVLLCDDVGLGKTLEIIMTVAIL
ncbi:SNF2 family amino-terminal protein, partial [Rhizoctonia solani 123E]